MIITRSPLRITLGGGGTDLPSYDQEYSGFLIAAAMDRCAYITLHRTFQQELILKYSQMDRTQTIEQVEHPIVREALRMLGFEIPYLEITSIADIPAGTGLGSSGRFTTALESGDVREFARVMDVHWQRRRECRWLRPRLRRGRRCAWRRERCRRSIPSASYSRSYHGRGPRNRPAAGEGAHL